MKATLRLSDLARYARNFSLAMSLDARAFPASLHFAAAIDFGIYFKETHAGFRSSLPPPSSVVSKMEHSSVPVSRSPVISRATAHECATRGRSVD